MIWLPCTIRHPPGITLLLPGTAANQLTAPNGETLMLDMEVQGCFNLNRTSSSYWDKYRTPAWSLVNSSGSQPPVRGPLRVSYFLQHLDSIHWFGVEKRETFCVMFWSWIHTISLCCHLVDNMQLSHCKCSVFTLLLCLFKSQLTFLVFLLSIVLLQCWREPETQAFYCCCFNCFEYDK